MPRHDSTNPPLPVITDPRRRVLNLHLEHGWNALFETLDAQDNPACTITLDPEHENARSSFCVVICVVPALRNTLRSARGRSSRR